MGIVQLHVYINISSGKPEFLFQQDSNSPPRLFLEIVPTIVLLVHVYTVGLWELQVINGNVVLSSMK